MKAEEMLLPGERVNKATPDKLGVVRISNNFDVGDESTALSVDAGRELKKSIETLTDVIAKKSGFYLGQVLWHMGRQNIPEGLVPSDGQELDRETFSGLFELVRDGKVPVISDKDWLAKPELRCNYSLGNGLTTFRVPDLNGKSAGSLGRVFLSGDGKGATINSIQGDAIRNITGELVFRSRYMYGEGDPTIFYRKSGIKSALDFGGYTSEYKSGTIELTRTGDPDKMIAPGTNFVLDASKVVPIAEENRPRNVAGVYLICFTGQTSSESDVNINNIAIKVAELENEVKKRKGFFVGQVQWVPSRNNLPAGSIPADGQLLNRGTYGSLFELVREGKFPTVTDDVWNTDPSKRACYTMSNDSASFRIPDYNGKSSGSLGRMFFSGDGKGSDLPGSIQGDAIRNITGQFAVRPTNQPKTNGQLIIDEGGAFKLDATKTGSSSGQVTTGDANFQDRYSHVNFNASNVVPVADENRPRNTSGCYVIFFAGETIDNGKLDPLKLAEEVNELSTKVGKFTGDIIGDVRWLPSRKTIPAGRLAADGQLVTRTTYPDLYDAISKGLVPVISDSEWLSNKSNRGFYTLGDGITTMRLPDYNGMSSGSLGRVFLSGDGLGCDPIGTIQGDAIRNITGSICTERHALFPKRQPRGAFNAELVDNWKIEYTFTPKADDGVSWTNGITMDASRVVPVADENRPRNIAGVYTVVVAASSANAGKIDAMYLAQEMERSNAELRKELSSLRLQKRIGDIYFVSHSENLEDAGEYVLNGDTYPLDSDVGKRLNSLSDTFKTNWSIKVTDNKINLPSFFKDANHGYFIRAGMTPGINQDDAIRNIRGSFAHRPLIVSAGTSTADNQIIKEFTSLFNLERGAGNKWESGITYGKLVNDEKTNLLTLDASSVVPTADENRPINISMIPVIYLGK